MANYKNKADRQTSKRRTSKLTRDDITVRYDDRPIKNGVWTGGYGSICIANKFVIRIQLWVKDDSYRLSYPSQYSDKKDEWYSQAYCLDKKFTDYIIGECLKQSDYYTDHNDIEDDDETF